MNKEFFSSADFLREHQALRRLSKLPEYRRWNEIKRTQVKGRPVIIVPGFLASAKFYAPLVDFLKNRGICAMVAEIGDPMFGFNCLSADKSLALLRNFIQRRVRAEEKCVLIGHSLGGLQALAVLPEFPGIGRVITLGSPFNGGTPWKFLQRMVTFFLGISAEGYEKAVPRMLGHVPSFAHKITAIASSRDQIAPPERCRIEGAENIVFTERDEEGCGEEERLLNSHMGLPFFLPVKQLILERVAQ